MPTEQQQGTNAEAAVSTTTTTILQITIIVTACQLLYPTITRLTTPIPLPSLREAGTAYLHLLITLQRRRIWLDMQMELLVQVVC
jgi:hypothetical protein